MFKFSGGMQLSSCVQAAGSYQPSVGFEVSGLSEPLQCPLGPSCMVPPAGRSVVQLSVLSPRWAVGGEPMLVQPWGEPSSLWTAFGGVGLCFLAAPDFGPLLLRSTLCFLPVQLPAFISGVKQWEDPGGEKAVRVYPTIWETAFPLLIV